MTSFADYRKHDALSLADLVKRKQVSPKELLDVAVARTREVNGKINAVTMEHDDLARKTIDAGLPQGPFTGVPYLLKDLGAGLKGTVTTGSFSLVRELVSGADSTYVERCRAAGLVMFGKTHSPELGLSPSSESKMFGATRNPWALDHIAGGSSGGAAAAVAAGIVPVAHATDGGGSIRIPAACCGLFGLKPTRARTPSGPLRGEGWGGMSVGHVVSRSVRDSAAFLDATSGPAAGDPYAAPPPVRPFLEEMKAKPGKLRIALWMKPVLDAPLHDDVVAATRDVAKLCESLGHHVEEASPSLNGVQIMQAQGVVINANIAATLDEAANLLHGREPRSSDVERATWYRVEQARKAGSSAYAGAMNTLHMVGRTLAHFMENYDVILQPTCAQPPLKVGVLNMDREDIDHLLRDLLGFIPFTGLFNITGQPSMNVPLVWNKAGLPIGTMFSGRFGDEATLFRLAAQLEEARPWMSKTPPL